jgi:hypothetical protein
VIWNYAGGVQRAVIELKLRYNSTEQTMADGLLQTAGYPTRPGHFPQSVVLCGVRDIQDYRIHASSEKAPITGGSAFNIKAESLRLGDFVRRDVDALLSEHTNETGQPFTPAARELIWELTQSQP